MATIKSFTDLPQSKVLIEILSPESADMYYSPVPVRKWKDKEDTSKGTQVVIEDQIFAIEDLPSHKIGEGEIYAWSLAALLSVLPKIGAEEPMVKKLYYANEPKERYICEYGLTHITNEYDNPVDACYEMILKLHALNLM